MPDNMKVHARFKQLVLVLSYEGTNYHGIQYAGANVPTVTREVVRALQQTGMCPRRAGGHLLPVDREPNPAPYNFTMMSRTDAQVHACRSVVALAANSLEPATVHPSGHVPEVVDRLNAALPDDIRVLSAVRCPAGLPARNDISNRRYEMHVPLASLLPDAAASAVRQWPLALAAARSGRLEVSTSSFDPEEPLAAPVPALGSRVAYPKESLTAAEERAISRFREALSQLVGWNDFHNFTDKRSRSDGVRWRRHGQRRLGEEWVRFPPAYYDRVSPGGVRGPAGAGAGADGGASGPGLAARAAASAAGAADAGVHGVAADGTTHVEGDEDVFGATDASGGTDAHAPGAYADDRGGPAEGVEGGGGGNGRLGGRGGRRRRAPTDLRERLKDKPRSLPDPSPVRDSSGRLQNQHDNWKDWPEEAWSYGMRGWATDKGMRRCVTRCSAEDPVVFVAADAAGAAQAAAADRAAEQAADALDVPEGGWAGARARGYQGVSLRHLVIPDVRQLSPGSAGDFRSTGNDGSAGSGGPPPVGCPEDVSLPVLRVRVEGSSFILHQIRSMVGLAAWVARGEGSLEDLSPSDVRAFLDLPRAPTLPLAPASTLILRDMELGAHLPAVMQPQPPLHPWPRGEDGATARASSLEPVTGPKALSAHLASIARGETPLPPLPSASGSAEDDVVPGSLRAAAALLPPKIHLLPPAAAEPEAEFFRRRLQPRIAGMSTALLHTARIQALLDALKHRAVTLQSWSEGLCEDSLALERALRLAVPAAPHGRMLSPADAGRLSMPADADDARPDDDPSPDALMRPWTAIHPPPASPPHGGFTDAARERLADSPVELAAKLLAPPSLGGRAAPDALDEFLALQAATADGASYEDGSPVLAPPPAPHQRDEAFAEAMAALGVALPALPDRSDVDGASLAAGQPCGPASPTAPAAAAERGAVPEEGSADSAGLRRGWVGSRSAPDPADRLPLVPRARPVSALEAALCVANGVTSVSRLVNSRRVRLSFPGFAVSLAALPADDLTLLRRNAAAYAAASAPRHIELAQQRFDAQRACAEELLGREAVELCLALRDGVLEAEASPALAAGSDLQSPLGPDPELIHPIRDAPTLASGGVRAECGYSIPRVLRSPSPPTPPPADAAASSSSSSSSSSSPPGALAGPAAGHLAPDAAAPLLPRHLPVALRAALGLHGTALQCVVRAAALRVAGGVWPLLAPAEAYVRLVEAEGPWALVEEGLMAGVVQSAIDAAAITPPPEPETAGASTDEDGAASDSDGGGSLLDEDEEALQQHKLKSLPGRAALEERLQALQEAAASDRR
ncbi:hypothetical protein FNF29_07947 [Cafeteria roenbergensis]|uniref:Uncharacterized protein n=1 Tax=Cafeteria roenbergensis TaxID=33653 RepID=A0A5A8C1I4_CAFRO|nr:hypothetical protein FNF29_07947 [Cafeteria roenbergensis]|eukprot:KAA0146614.1 hypothetical protein FNF29_07947 [Cafeteria roenbergensis]